jgi:hypothetical protein
MFYTKGIPFSMTSGFSMIRSRYLVNRNAKTPIPKMPKCHFKDILGFATPGFFNAEAHGSLSSGFPVFQIPNL